MPPLTGSVPVTNTTGIVVRTLEVRTGCAPPPVISIAQIGRHLRNAIIPPSRETVFDREIAALDEAHVREPALESAQVSGKRYARVAGERANHRHRRLLRARRERPCRGTAEQRDQLPASHSRPQGVKTTHGIVSQPSGSWNGARGMWAATNCSGCKCRLWVPRPGQNRKNSELQN